MTVHFPGVPDFAQFPQAQAEQIIYDQIIPACEAKDVFLSRYGNCSGWGSLVSKTEYLREKAAKTLFSVERIQRAVAFLPTMLKAVTQYNRSSSYRLKHKVEERQGEYITNGDFIVAMLILGYQARFAKRGAPLSVNCQFKVKVI